ESELVALCKRCLAADRNTRPRNAGEVAGAVHALRAEAEERARQAERERAAAEARAVEQRKRRKVQLMLAAAVALLLAAGGAFAWWNEKKQAERAAFDRERQIKAEHAREQATRLLALAAELRKQYRFDQAADALTQASSTASGSAPDLLPAVEQAQRDLAFVIQLDDIRFRKWIWITEPGGRGDFNTKIASPEYRKAFADRGLDLATLDPTEAAKRIRASAVKAELVAAVDDWALWEPDRALRDRLLEIARRADPRPWTDRLRDAAAWKDRRVLARL